jgi:hypothetical protein
VVNPGAGTGNTISVSSSSDTATLTGGYTIDGPRAVISPSVLLSSGSRRAPLVAWWRIRAL